MHLLNQPRRRHKKSRHGCAECKRRHVKVSTSLLGACHIIEARRPFMPISTELSLIAKNPPRTTSATNNAHLVAFAPVASGTVPTQPQHPQQRPRKEKQPHHHNRLSYCQLQSPQSAVRHTNRNPSRRPSPRSTESPKCKKCACSTTPQ